MQKEREEEERPTRHSHYLIHGTPSQPSDKSLARWDGALKADERDTKSPESRSRRRTLFQTQFKKMWD